jgi:hypothetical protein
MACSEKEEPSSLELTASEARHHLASNEGQKENKWKRENFSIRNGGNEK